MKINRPRKQQETTGLYKNGNNLPKKYSAFLGNQSDYPVAWNTCKHHSAPNV
jgi:hypothetical protein